MIKAWDFDFNIVPGSASPDYEDHELVQRAYDHNLELMASLEARGFEGVFFSEHHFLNALSPCPNLLIAALAQRTRALKIGVMGNVLPLHQPWRLAEEIGMLDYLTHGRLEIGVAVGVPPEFLFIGVAPSDIRPMFTEVLEYLEKARRERYVTLKGRYYSLEDVPTMPRPRKEPRRRHWQTVYSETSCREAAARGYKICTGYQSVDNAVKAYDAYRDEAAKHGHEVSPDDIGIRRQVLLWDTDSEAKALNDELQVSSRARMADTFAAVRTRLEKAGAGPSESVKKTGVIDADAVPRQSAAPNKVPDVKVSKDMSLEASPDEYIFGAPQTVADNIIDQCRRLGAGNILAYHCPTMDEAQLARHYDLWKKVVPILKKADLTNKRAA